MLKAVERDLLSPRILQRAIEQSLARAALAPMDDHIRRRSLERSLAEIEQDLRRYAIAIAEIGPVEEVLAEIKEREARRAEIKTALARLPASDHVLPFDRGKLLEEIRMRLTGWRAIIRRNPHEGRQLLKLLKGRLRFEPKEDAQGPVLRVQRGGCRLRPNRGGHFSRGTGDPGGLRQYHQLADSAL